MSPDEALWASLVRVAGEAGRLVRGAAEGAAKELSGALGRDEQRLKWPGSGRPLAGPIIPASYKQAGQTITWHDGYMASCVLSVARTVQRDGAQPATAALVAAQAVLHARPGGYRLMQVGLNAHRVLHHGEWRRLGSVLLHADLPHLAANCTTLALEGLPLERRLGSARFLALVASTGALTQALYLLTTRAAAGWLPNSSLADDYFSAYSVGFSGVAMALKVVAGYVREADLAAAQVPASEEFLLTAGHLGVWPSLLFSHCLVPTASLPGHLCGIAAGVLHVYGARALGWLWRRMGGRWRRRLQGGRLRPAAGGALRLVGAVGHPGLGWGDLASQLLLGAGTCAVLHAAARARQ